MNKDGIGLLVLLGVLLSFGSAAAQSVVPTRAIRGNTIITAADVGLVQSNYPGAIKSVDDVIGLEARVSLYPGRPISKGDIGRPSILVRNQIVTMIYDIGGLRITAEGRALDRAGSGEMVRVMNTDSRATVSGRVRDDGTVEVGRQ